MDTVADGIVEEEETFTVSITFDGELLSGGSVVRIIDGGEAPPASGAPSAPTDYMALDAVDTGGVTLLWGPPAYTGEPEADPDDPDRPAAPAPLTGYEYEVDGDGNWLPTGDGPNYGLVIAGLDSAAGHTFRLRAVNAAGPGAPTEPFEVIRVAAAHDERRNPGMTTTPTTTISSKSPTWNSSAAIHYDVAYHIGRDRRGGEEKPREWRDAFPHAVCPWMGCKDYVCEGYELTRDLDFNGTRSATPAPGGAK